MLDKIFESKNIIHKALDASWMRNQVIAQNIANVDTPNYKRKTVTFEEQLLQEMSKSDFKNSDVENVDIKVIQENSNLSYRLDGNNVDIDTESAALAENTIRYNALVQCAGYSSIKYVLENAK
ncbi:flagellar basal body rod protein FlgB [Lacrimispora defluvii]|uniref:Flagellar basal body rod protein FlgB n=1 Tax=Lacrimispora defluvii TaxID=2719233 RepID=A0ABX1VU85_9FIRM|nr:flagellar basal body rod protein FlgB [Lacrimispora defluvii]NNJ32005.1 flagellar basal body rod protein FlgB [Lacrimispora defluvii]